MNPILWRHICALRRGARGKLWRRVCENHGFAAAQMITAALMTLISATVAIYFMISALNRAETENWTSRAQILCSDASRAVQNWLSRASGVEPGLPSDGSVKEAELVCFLAADPDGSLLWRAFRGGTLESWTRDAEDGTMAYTPLVADANDLSYRFDPDTGAYDFGPDGRAAISIQVFCAEASPAEDTAAEGAAAKKPRMENALTEDAEIQDAEIQDAAAEDAETGAMAEYLFRATVSILPVGGGEGVANTFTIRPLLAPPMRGIQRDTGEMEQGEEAAQTEEMEQTGEAEEETDQTEETP